MEILIRDFYASLRDDRSTPVTTEEAISTMEIMDEVWEQIGMTRPVTEDTRQKSLVHNL
jgi:hypothetical protein